MNTLTKTEFNGMGKDKLIAMLPILLTTDGDAWAIVGAPNDFIYIGDMHPRVKIQMKAKEALVRKGMVKTAKTLEQ